MLSSERWANDDEIATFLQYNFNKALADKWLVCISTENPKSYTQVLKEGNDFMEEHKVKIKFRAVRPSQYGNWDWFIT